MTDKKNILTLSNLLSVLRAVLLAPILLCLARGETGWALGLMVVAGATDFMDGYLARRLDQRSDFGRMADPVADKVVVVGIAGFMVLSGQYDFPLWFFVFILGREVVLMLCSFLVVRRRDVVMESNRAGKNSAFATALAIFLFAMRWQPYGWIVLWVALGLTLVSSWIYFRLFLRMVKQVDR